MSESVNDWLIFLRNADHLIGFPLLVGGAALMLFGFRMWRFCVVVSFGLIGAALTASFLEAGSRQIICAVAAGVVLAAVTYRPARYAAAVLGGMIIAFMVGYVLENSGMQGSAFVFTVLATLLVGTAYAFINRQLVIVFVTSMLGATLLVSGVAALVMAWPNFYGTVTSLGSTNSFVGPFLIVVPAVVSCFYQVGEVNRTHSEV